MAAVLEGAQWIKARWEFTDEDFRRIWIFCALLLLAAALYAFTASGGPGDLQRLLPEPKPRHRAQCRQHQRPYRRGADSLAADDLLPVCGRAGLQLARGHPAGNHFGNPAAPVAKSPQAGPALARGAKREYFLSLLHAVPVRRQLPHPRGQNILLGAYAPCWPGRFGRCVRGGLASRSGPAPWRRPSCWATAANAASGRLYRLFENYNAQWFSRRRRRRHRSLAEQDRAGPDWPAERLRQDRHSPGTERRQPRADAAARSQLSHLEKPGLVLRRCPGQV